MSTQNHVIPEKVLELIWEPVGAEHSLISNRLGLSCTSQSFSLTAFGASVWQNKPAYRRLSGEFL